MTSSTLASSSSSHRQRPQLVIPGGATPATALRAQHEAAYGADRRGKGKARAVERETVTPDDREPWTLSLAALERFLAARDEKRVIFLLGDPPAAALYPLLASSSLSGSLILLASLDPAASSSAQMLHPMPPSHPTIRTLKPDAKAAQQNQPEAVRIMQLLERGERVARAWRKQVQAQAQQIVLPAGAGDPLREMDSLSELSSPGTPPTPEPSRPVSPSSSSIFTFTRIGRRSSAASVHLASPLPRQRTFDAVVVFLPSSPLTAAAGGTSDFELRAHAAHVHLKLAILAATLAAPFLVSRRQADAALRGSPDHRGSESMSGSLFRPQSNSRNGGLSAEEGSANEKRSFIGMLKPRLRRPSTTSSTHSSPARRPAPLASSASIASSSSLPNSLTFNLHTLPAQLIHVLPPGLDKGTQATLARSLDGFLSSFNANTPSQSAPDSPGALAMQTIHACLLPLGALSDPVTLPISTSTSNIPYPHPQPFSPIELLLANSVRPPAVRQTRWLPSLHPPNISILPSHCLTATPSPSPSPLSSALSSASTEGSLVLSPSHPLNSLAIPIRSHVLHSRADSMGKHRSGHQDRKGLLLQGAQLPTPPESDSSEENYDPERGEAEESVKTPTTAGSVATVRKRRWGRQY